MGDFLVCTFFPTDHFDHKRSKPELHQKIDVPLGNLRLFRSFVKNAHTKSSLLHYLWISIGYVWNLMVIYGPCMPFSYAKLLPNLRPQALCNAQLLRRGVGTSVVRNWMMDQPRRSIYDRASKSNCKTKTQIKPRTMNAFAFCTIIYTSKTIL